VIILAIHSAFRRYGHSHRHTISFRAFLDMPSATSLRPWKEERSDIPALFTFHPDTFNAWKIYSRGIFLRADFRNQHCPSHVPRSCRSIHAPTCKQNEASMIGEVDYVFLNVSHLSDFDEISYMYHGLSLQLTLYSRLRLTSFSRDRNYSPYCRRLH